MKPTQTLDSESLPLEEQLVGINAETAPYPAAHSRKEKMPGILDEAF